MSSVVPVGCYDNSPPWKTEYTLNKHILNMCNLFHDSDNLQG
jgi:hypothetical protein